MSVNRHFEPDLKSAKFVEYRLKIGKICRVQISKPAGKKNTNFKIGKICRAKFQKGGFYNARF